MLKATEHGIRLQLVILRMVDFSGSTSGKSNRFVCPNDRQLALRAKLKTGWSVKTACLGGFNSGPTVNQPLGEDEQQSIVDVIQRAEKLDLTEQERVGKLVQKLENMRRNALGRSSNQCLLCGDTFGIFGPQKVRCIDCGRWACLRCAIDKDPNTKGHCSFLCMICSETREIWKKSGAWFFKGLPKYILPCDSRFKRSRSVRLPRKYREEESSSDDERRMQSWGRQRRHSGTESTQDVPEQEAANYSVTNNLRPASSHELSKELEPLRSYMGAINLSGDPKPWDESTSDYKTDTDNGEASRRESMASRSMSEWNWSDTRSSDDKLLSPSTSSVKSCAEEPQKPPVDTSMGIIELSLNYDQATNILHCTVYRAKNLIPMDIGGLSDPFCKLNILPNAKVSTRLRTKTIHKTRNPEFNENLTFYDITEDDLANKALHVLVVDDDRYGHDYMGEVRIKLAKLRVQNTIYVSDNCVFCMRTLQTQIFQLTVPLENLRPEQKGPLPAPELNQWFDFDLWARGQILISLCYSTKKRALLVTIRRCTNLLPMDNNGFSDPFVKLQLKPDPCHKKHKTSVKWKNLNPVFNEEFAFETRPTELYMQSLYITVFDKDYGKSNDYLGGLILGGSGSKGQRLKHWLDMIRYPDHHHDQWHNLTEDILN
ncbi:rabphilin-3A isoform X2 [Anthonomus grandis grandis]|uniref:rabphilin-3A isoform X2 n=1 Tax=Anthonomus grandis grandis TaxID=2921223 RepID=UPI0021651FE3|nr:rabphilin-3A isoform X2 [Anthonomus grandis grandis]